jgi:hypothetical protein
MRSLRAFLLRLAAPFTGSRRDAEFRDELESHLQLHIADNLHAGMAPDEARRQAIMKLGGVAQTIERQRERRGLPFVDTLRQDPALHGHDAARQSGLHAHRDSDPGPRHRRD